MDLLFTDVTTEEELIAGECLAMCATLGTEQTDVGGMVLSTTVRASRDVDAYTADLSQSFFLESLTDRTGETARLGDRDVARVRSRACNDVAREFGTRSRHVDGNESLVERFELVLAQPSEHDVLTVGETNVGDELALDRSERTELIRGDVTECGIGDRRDRALGGTAHDACDLPRAIRVRSAQIHSHALADLRHFAEICAPSGQVASCNDLGWNSTRPRGRSRKCVAHLDDTSAHFFDAELVDDPLQSRAQLVVAVAGLVENAQCRLDRRQQVLAAREVLECERRMRCRSEPTRDVHAEAVFDLAGRGLAGDGDDSDVVEHRLAAVRRATGEVDLELAWQALADRVAHEVTERRLGPRGDVELLVRACAGEVTSHHVAHGVTTRLTTGETDRGELAQEVGDAAKLHEVELDVLSRGDVAPAAREVSGEFGHQLELVRSDRTRRQLDAHHLVGAALALAIDAVVESHHAEHVLGDLAREVLLDGDLETLDVAQLLLVEVARERRRGDVGIGGDAHVDRHWCSLVVGVRVSGSPISRSASLSARTRRRAWSGERCAARPSPGRPSGSSVNTTCGVASS